MSQRIKFGTLPEGYLIVSDYQKQGRGQRGNSWVSEPGKNLLFSLYLKPKFLDLRDQFYITLIAALALRDSLEDFGLENVKIKWPNDVMVEDRKIAGILTEGSVYQGIFENAILGIGLNVNEDFSNNSNATSIRKEVNSEVEKEEVLASVLLLIEKYYLSLKSGKTNYLLEEYYKSLLWIGEEREFESQEGVRFYGIIQGIDSRGRLRIQTKEDIKTFNIKEIKFIA